MLLKNSSPSITQKAVQIQFIKKNLHGKLEIKIQGEDVKGDLITMTLNPFMKTSTYSGSFDADGFSLEPVTILEKGVLKRYIANTRYAHYLNVEPTGNINNIIVYGGSKTVNDLKKEPYLETAGIFRFYSR